MDALSTNNGSSGDISVVAIKQFSICHSGIGYRDVRILKEILIYFSFLFLNDYSLFSFG